MRTTLRVVSRAARVSSRPLHPVTAIVTPIHVVPTSIRTVTLLQVKTLRERTGAGIKDVKLALDAAEAELGVGAYLDDRAIELLRKKGVATANKKAGRVAAQGVVAIRINDSGTSGTVLEVNSETDFVSKSEKFTAFVADLSGLSVTASAPVDSVSGVIAPIEAKSMLESSINGTSVQTALTDLIASVRENMQVRRAATLTVRSDGGGAVAGYIHQSVQPPPTDSQGKAVGMGRIGVLIAVEADKPESRPQVQALAQKLAMHIAAAGPKYLTFDKVPAEEIAKESEIARLAAGKLGKSEAGVDAHVKKALAKLDSVLMFQGAMVGNPDEGGAKPPVISELLAKEGKKLGEKALRITGFARWQVGEGIEVAAKMSFAEEVAEKQREAAAASAAKTA